MFQFLFLIGAFAIVTQGLVPLEDAKHECYRTCSWPPEPKVCNYIFEVEWYYSMSKACYDCPFNPSDCQREHCVPINGVERPVITVNRRFPGPSVQVCEGDIVNVTVINHMGNGEGISIHWHGIHHRHSPFMDGTAFITQCPIASGNSFRYTFEAKSTGTHFWHAHVGLQRQDGLVGSLVVRQAIERDPHRNEYDVDAMEYYILVMDWLDDVTLDKFLSHHHDKNGNEPEAIVINGKGKRNKFTRACDPNEYFTEREVFKVQHGMRYRFRMASNAGTNCAMRISVDNHRLTMIASDGRPFVPVEVDSFIINGGERFDFVLNANQDKGNYWMRVKGLAGCSEQEELAIVRYIGADDVNPIADESIIREGFEMNPRNEMESNCNMPIDRVRSLEPDDATLDPHAEVSTYYMAIDFNKINNDHFHFAKYYPIENIERSHHMYTPQLNHVSFPQPRGSLLTQHQYMDPSQFCDAKDVFNMTNKCSKEYCECIQVINAEMGEIIELVLVDEGITFDASHPMHLHGYSFRVVALQKLGTSTSIDDVIRMDQAGEITRNLNAAPLKDTVIVPDGGFTIIRFEANNPGWWFFHCHIEFHVEIGMSLVVHVGEDEDLPPIPAEFPTCYDWP